MFDIGFAELIIIGVVGLLVIGPERLPGAIRTGSVWLGRLRRGFNDIKREVQQELHNDEVMQELRRTSDQVRKQADDLRRDLSVDEQPPTEQNSAASPPAGDSQADDQGKTDKTLP